MTAEEFFTKFPTNYDTSKERMAKRYFTGRDMIEFAKAYHEHKTKQEQSEKEAMKKECNAPEGFICNINNNGLCELPTSCDYQS